MLLKILEFKSPLKVLHGHNGYTTPLKLFRCVYFIHTKTVSKLDLRALRCIFVRYSPHIKVTNITIIHSENPL